MEAVRARPSKTTNKVTCWLFEPLNPTGSSFKRFWADSASLDGPGWTWLVPVLSGADGRCCPRSLHCKAAMNVWRTRRQASRKNPKSVQNPDPPLTCWFRLGSGGLKNTDGLVRGSSELSDGVFFCPKPRGVGSKGIRQKERLVRYETPPRAAGGGTPGENIRTKAEDETRDRGSNCSQTPADPGPGPPQP